MIDIEDRNRMSVQRGTKRYDCTAQVLIDLINLRRIAGHKRGRAYSFNVESADKHFDELDARFNSGTKLQHSLAERGAGA